MAEIRLNKLIKQFNVGLSTLVDVLNGMGAKLDMSPSVNSKVSDEYLPALEKKFGEDKKANEEALKADIRMKELLGNNGKKTKEEDEWEPARETIIKNTGLSGNGPVKKDKEVPTAPMEKKPEPEPAAEPEPSVKTEKLVEETKEAEPISKSVDVAKSEPDVNVAESPKSAEKTTPVREQANKSEKKPTPTHAGQSANKQTSKEPRKNLGKPTTDDNAPIGPKIVGKLPTNTTDIPRRPRIGENGKVDVSTIEPPKPGHKPGGGNTQGGRGGKQPRPTEQGKGGRRRGGRSDNALKPTLTTAEEEEKQRQIQKQVKDTYARMNESKKSNFGAKYRKEKREQEAEKMREEMERGEAERKILKVTEYVTVNELATLMNKPVNQIISSCFNLGLMVSINQRLDAETLVLVAEDSGYKVEFVTAQLTQELQDTEVDSEDDLETRPPVITVMGHVDHGKTSLLDYIRKTNVIAGEAGGITQHIGAYNVELPTGRRITFLDTPGHEAFTAMRARGAQMTDLAIIIIAADDAVMPQTVEAISHAQAAGVPMVFAINKIDKPGAQPEKIYQQLSQMNILTEAWGGKYQCQEISAKKGINVDKLLDKVLLETDLMDLKANPSRLGSGAVIESSLDKGRGYLATVLVQNGTVHKGDVILSGSFYGRVKAMLNERGQVVKEAGPSTPVSILGLNGAPSAGEKFRVMTDEKEAKSKANQIEQLLRVQGIKTQKHMTLEEIGRRIAIGKFKELNVIVKGDVDGSVEALSDSLIKLSTEEVSVNVIHKAVGAISESDVMLASASDAIIIGFQVRPSVDARNLAEKEGIEIRLYSIIYDAINEVKDGMEGMLEPDTKEEVTATAYVKQTFRISKVGTIAGCLVREGKLIKGSKVRLIRDGIVIYTGELGSLKRGKDDAKEVLSGMECGLGISGYNDIKEEDIIEAFQVVEIKRKL